MRTTLSLDDDVAALLKRLQAESGRTWKETVNSAVRAGAEALDQNRRSRRTVSRTVAVNLGSAHITDISNIHEVLSLAEGDSRP